MNSRWFRPILLSALMLVPAAAPAADREFNRIVHRLTEHYQKKPMRGMGFLAFLANCFSPSGISHLKMAVFEDVNAAARPLDGDFEAFLKTTLESGYQPFVTVRSTRNGESVHLYAREAGDRMELLMVCAERTEAVVLKARVDPKALEEWMNEPARMAKGSAHGMNSH